MTLAFFGGIYNNHRALAAAIADAQSRGVDRMFCLGDLGAFGPYPDRVFPLLQDNDIAVVQGNYDHSIGNELNDCQCGYTDPRDNHFAQISYDYTLANTSAENRRWLKALPAEIRFEQNGRRFLLCHGSPRKTNEFLWQSTSSTHFLEKLADNYDADIIFGTHTGLHWQRELSGGRRFINVGALGRPANDGRTCVWYALLRVEEGVAPNGEWRIGNGEDGSETDFPIPYSPFSINFVPVEYDYERLADEMRSERLPDEFIETIRTGWWTTCLEVLPSRERRAGRY